MILSFAWTTPALLAEPCQKSVTRRDWSDKHAAKFHKGQLVEAWNRSPRYGGRPVAIVRLTADPIQEWTTSAPQEDFEREGFAYLESIGAKVDGMTPSELWESWHNQITDEYLYVVRFERVQVLGEAEMSAPGAREPESS